MSLADRIARGRLHYAWIIAGVTFLTLVSAAAIRATPGVLIVPLEQSFGWTRATISLAVSVNLLLYGLCGPFAAALMERLGVRRVMLVSFSAVAGGVLLTTVMRAPWQLVLLWGVVVGLGTGALAMVLAATMANRWFVEQRGLVIGVLTAGGATGQLLFLPILAAVVQRSGWRPAVLVVTGVALLMIPVIAIFVRDRPQDLGLRAFGDHGAGVASPPRPAPNPVTAALGALAEGMRSRDFWLLAGSFFICGLSTNGLIGTHLIPASMDHGMPAVAAASLLAAMGVFDLIGTTVSGWLSDRWDNRRLLCWYYGLRGLSLMLLPYAYGSQYFGLTLFTVFYGLDWVATVPPTVRLTETLFGKYRVGIMYGWIAVSHQAGAATAAFAAGLLRTWLGSYEVAFTGAGFICLVAALMVLAIGRGQVSVSPPRRTLEISGVVES
ncbi:MAG TPA: MFS transporter [Candidatus Dormibacteraeota bacterium]|nr:MFS transporter [Candidatus Dormibacteraeota bacterium]